MTDHAVSIWIPHVKHKNTASGNEHGMCVPKNTLFHQTEIHSLTNNLNISMQAVGTVSIVNQTVEATLS